MSHPTTSRQHIITHPEHADDYWRGYDAMQAEIDAMGWAAARDKFNAENPVGQKPSSLAAYYYSHGGITALSHAVA